MKNVGEASSVFNFSDSAFRTRVEEFDDSIQVHTVHMKNINGKLMIDFDNDLLE